ncbi:uncharacterized protein EAF01_005365 [Botrytis porri]|uniref:uncharacterized protein n=1 Tax=Botrytis porri TaxID=87229 RepID=UPI001900D6A0|nr:uncharacterized protein EAF01_005365 [Botrytis porri]KAF7907779.1 hypothetical protein EAF01_005365 [Botrytis porri]
MLPRKLSIFVSFFRVGLDFQHFLILLTCIGIACLVAAPPTPPTPSTCSPSPMPPLSPPPSPKPSSATSALFFPQILKKSSLMIRTGFRGICMTSQFASSGWECAQHAGILKDIITSASTSTSTNTHSTTDIDLDIDPLNLLQLAESVRKRIVFDGLLYIALPLTLLTLLLLLLIPRWKNRHKPRQPASSRQVKAFPSRALSFTICLTSGSAFLFAFTSILWQHLAAVTASRFIERMNYGSVVARVGSTAMVIGWLGVLMLWFAFMGCLLMVLSLRKVRTFG